MNDTVKSIAVTFAAVIMLGGALLLIHEHDNKFWNNSSRMGRITDTCAFRATEAEERIARHFTSTTLPQLQKLGLILTYTRTEVETLITVSGRLWNERSQFFKESLLTQVAVYNAVNNFSPAARIIDGKTSQLYAEIIPPDRRMVY